MSQEGIEALLEATAREGFLAPATIAAVLNLEERLLIELVDRLGGEVHIANLAQSLMQDIDSVLEADFNDDGTYTLRVVPV